MAAQKTPSQTENSSDQGREKSKSITADSSRDDVLQIKEYTAIDESVLTESYYDIRLRELGVREQMEFLDFRKEWSRRLLLLVVFIVVFNSIFLIAIGREWLRFQDEWLVRIIFAGSFIEVLGLAKIVVEFLFAEPPHKKEEPNKKP